MTDAPHISNKTSIRLPTLGYGAFKIGRNIGTKYSESYDIPDDITSNRFLNQVVDLGYTLIDTAPAYGFSEERVGRALANRRHEILLSTKVGESFSDGQSHFDFSEAGVRSSLERSFRRLQTDQIDIALIHSNGDDLRILKETAVVSLLHEYRETQRIRAIGLSGKTTAGAMAALEWADVLMVEFHLEDQSHAEVLKAAHERGVSVLIKKGLASGRLSPSDAIPFLLKNPAVSSVVIGGLNLDHLRENLAIVGAMRHVSK